MKQKLLENNHKSKVINVVVKAIVLLFLLSNSVANAQTLKRGNFTRMKNKVSGNYNFWIYTPADYSEDQHHVPLIIFLHGASLCGNNLEKVRRYGPLDAIERGKIIPAAILAPQNPGGAWKPERLLELLEWTVANYRIDTSRVYVIGMSLGGYGTLDFTCAYPEKIAAAMALCGGISNTDNIDGLGKFPLWIMHGTADRAVGVDKSKIIVEKLKDSGQDNLLRYKWFEGGSHGLMARLFYLQKTYDWLFAHSTADNPRSVDRSFDIDYEDVKSTYDELRWFKDMFEDD